MDKLRKVTTNVLVVYLAVVAVLCYLYHVINIKTEIIFMLAFMMSISGGLIIKLSGSKKYYIFILELAILSFLSAEIGNMNDLSTMSFTNMILNIITIVLIYMVTIGLVGKFIFATSLINIFFALVAICEYYVFEFRKLPLSFSNLWGISAAASVIKNYTFKWNIYVTIIILHLIISLGVFILFVMTGGLNKKINTRYRFGLISIPVIGMFVIYNTNLTSSEIGSWDMQIPYHKNGFIVNNIKSVTIKKVEKPLNYESRIDDLKYDIYNQAEAVEELNLNEYPDIILIVNESFYDLRQLVDFTTDKEVMPYIDHLENAVKGFAVNSNMTTANSEFEILTSNTFTVVPNVMPFTNLDLKEIGSIPRTLGELGYISSAFHSAPGKNYNRIEAYKDLGFDQLYFEEDMKEEKESIRYFVSDACVYDNLIEFFNRDQSDSNQFFYCLTLQNHGGYDLGMMDYTVNVTSGLENTDEYREFLSLMQISDKAFYELTEYFKEREKPTIVCMLGDHNPVMVSRFNKGFETELAYKGTPFVLWANYPIEEKNLGYFSMCYVSNIIKNYAGIPLTPYEQYLENLKETLPVLNRDVYADTQLNLYTYVEDSQYRSLVDDYLCVQYDNIAGKEDRKIYKYKFE